jgi:hypothetical protein
VIGVVVLFIGFIFSWHAINVVNTSRYTVSIDLSDEGQNNKVVNDDFIIRLAREAMSRLGFGTNTIELEQIQPGITVGTNAIKSNRFSTAWSSVPTGEGFIVYVEIEEDAANCKVVKSK